MLSVSVFFCILLERNWFALVTWKPSCRRTFRSSMVSPGLSCHIANPPSRKWLPLLFPFCPYPLLLLVLANEDLYIPVLVSPIVEDRSLHYDAKQPGFSFASAMFVTLDTLVSHCKIHVSSSTLRKSNTGVPALWGYEDPSKCDNMLKYLAQAWPHAA